MEYVVNGGKSEYVIYRRENAAEPIVWAAEELQSFLEQSSGVRLPIVSEAQEGKKHIYLGVAPLGEEGKAKELNDSGFCLQTKGNELYVFSKMPVGVAYGVYELLTRLIGWQIYARDEIDFEKKGEIALPNLDVTENPCIEYRVINSHWTEDKATCRRMRKMWMDREECENMQSLPDDEWYHTLFSHLFCHTSFMLLPPEKDGNGKLLHPDWYNEEVNQLCWTNEEATDALTEKLKKHIVEWKNGKLFLIGEEDNSSYCHCARCQKVYEKYGVSGAHIRFINRIAEKVEAWRKETMPEREFSLACFAYLKVKNPPVVYDKNTKSWQPIDESVRLNDKVAVFNAIIDACGYHSLESGCNADVKVRFEKWAAISKQMLVWDYHACFDNFFVNIYDFPHYADYVKHYVKYHAKLLFSEGNGFSHTSGFPDFKVWLMSRLAWNYEQDAEKLTDEYFAAYYREAATEMKEFLTALRDHYRDLEKVYAKLGKRGFHMSYDTLGYPDALTERHWSKETLDGLAEILARAKKKAETIEDELVRGKVLRRIKTELCAIEYLYIEIHTYYATEQEFNSRIEQFKKDCEECGLTRLQDWTVGKTIDDCLMKWSCRYPARDRERENA